ncbi:MAG: BTAD domain-containing putative transcriptional regulator, partial [Thermoplasmata archaeon]
EYYQKLMTLYATRGMYNQALLVYKSLQEILKKELNTKPDGVTEAIYHNIIQKTDISPHLLKNRDFHFL